MNLRRFASAAALSAGIAITAGGQTPEPKKADTPPAAPAAPSAPATNSDLEKAGQEFQKGNVDKCMEHLKAAVEKDKNLPPAKIILAGLYAQVQQNQQAAQNARVLLEQASIEEPDHPDPYLVSGNSALNEGRLMDAMLCFESALAKSGSARWLTDQRKRFVKSAREGLARVYGNRRDFKQAYEQLKALLSDDPKLARVRVEMANLEFMMEQPEAATANLKQAFADDSSIDLPEVMMARFWDGKPNKKAGEEGKAEEWFKKALAAYPKDIKASREYARWLLNQNRVADADTQLAEALKIDPANNEAKALTGLSNRYKKNYAEAEKTFDDLNRADRSNPFYAWNYAICMAESPDKNKQEAAVTLAKITQQQQARSPEAVSVLAWCLYKAGRNEEAKQAMGIAAQASQGQFPPDTVYYFAKILDKDGKSADARDNLQKAIDAKAPFVYRAEAEAFQKELIAKHGPVKKDEPKPEDKKPEDKKP